MGGETITEAPWEWERKFNCLYSVPLKTTKGLFHDHYTGISSQQAAFEKCGEKKKKSKAGVTS